ncbi:TipJ family phage tail tip protein [Brevundimonas naejangsanensis]|uniref:TipJ family phage tail tip protein n=1 Tax=Brevundimonas naejangsanensis TaxID=588932 RepID=UPI0026F35CE0|nr:fibronectin type III domain-containing protein [Brevundimonas naejangsanensis]
MADGSLPIVVTPEAFGRGAFDLTVVEGLTVRAMLVEAVRSGLPIEALSRTEIYVAGARLDRQTALDHVLTADQVVNVVVEPMGGGGGRKDIGQILLTVAVIAVSAWVGGGAATPAGFFDKLLVRTALAGAVGLAGQALIGALYGPGGGPAKANDRYALQSASNQYRQWGPMPLALGEVVTAPDLAAKTFTQSQGDDVWMYGILGLHYGPCEVAEVRIGDTLVSTMGAGDFRMVQHLEPGPRTFQLYPNDVDQLDLNEELKATPSSATPLIRAASSDGSRFDIDFFLPGGLHFQKDDGRLLTAHASVAVRFRPIDENGAATGSWQAAPSWARTSATKDPLRVTHSVHLPHGRYEFELTRNRPDDDNDKRRDTILVSAIKSVAFRKPIADETLSIIEFAVRATAVNQGGLAPITCRIVPKCPTWTGSAWGPAVATSNPAAVARWLMTGPAPAKPLLSAQADARLRAWHQLCDQYDWTCHYYLTEAGRTQSEALGILERAGRAGLFWDGTQLAASPWVEKPIPAQVFTDSNLKDHRWEVVYSDPVHALRVEFQNIEKAGEPDELFVYNDGYGEVADPAKGVRAATLVEALRLDGQATPNRAFRDGRWALGRRKHQRRIDTWTADVEHLISQYGSRVRLAWNRAGGGSARVRCRRWSEDGSAVVGLRLSAPVEMSAGVSYAVDLRTKGGLYDGVPIQTQPGVTREILFVSPRSPSVCPSAGDLIAFGELEKVSEDVEIIAIEPGENLTAVLTGVRYVAPLLMAGETGPIPPLSSKLSGDRQANPPRPTLLGVTADAHAVRVSFDLPTWRGSPLSGFTVRWRARGEGADFGSWAPLPALDATARQLIAPPLREAPIEGVEATRVEIEITATTVDGRASKPLQVTVVKPVPAAPTASVWSVEAKGPAADGVSQPILVVRGEVNDPAVAAVRIAWGLTDNGPWTEAYQGAPLTKALEIGNLTPGVEHYVAVTHLSAQGVPSQFLVIGPRVPAPLLAGGLAPDAAEELLEEARTAVQEQIEAATETLRQGQLQLEQAQAALDALVTQSNAAFDGRLAALDSGLDGVQQGQASLQTLIDGKASQEDLNFVINRQGSQEAIIGTLTATINDLPNQYVSATSYNTLSAEVAGARGGYANLSGRFSAQQQALVDGLAGKVAVSDFSSLNSRVTSAEGTIAGHAGRLTSVEAEVSGRVKTSDFNNLSGTVSTLSGTVGGHNSRLSQVEADVQGKASAQTVSDLAAYASTRGRTFFQATAPTSTQNSPLHAGDLWVHTGDQRKLYAWNGTAWVFADDQSVRGDISALVTRTDRVEADVAGRASVKSVEQLELSVGGFDSRITNAQTLAQQADGRVSALVTHATDVNGVITGTYSYNNGVSSSYRIRTDVFALEPSASSGARLRFANGKISIFNSANIEVVQLGLGVTG